MFRVLSVLSPGAGQVYGGWTVRGAALLLAWYGVVGPAAREGQGPEEILRLLRGQDQDLDYLDGLDEARKVLVEELAGTLVTIAKDVKIQVEFNPARVAAYRLIGYENRMLAAQDFNDDKKDAGEIGAGHTVTALYEIVPAGAASDVRPPPVDDLRYQMQGAPNEAAQSGELLTLKIRYKQPDGDTSTKLEFPARDEGKRFGQATQDFRFAAAVASFGMLLRDSQFKGNATYAGVLETATEAASGDTTGYRKEFLKMVARAQELAGR